MKIEFSKAVATELEALRSGTGIFLIAVTLAYALVLQVYPQSAANPAFMDDASGGRNIRWIIVNCLSFYFLVRYSGWLGAVFRFYVSVIATLNITSIVYFGSRLTFGAIEAGFETNPSELQGLLTSTDFAPLVIFLVCFSGLTYFAARVPKNTWLGSLFLGLTLLIVPAKLAALTLKHSQSAVFMKWQRWPLAGTVIYYEDMATLSDLVAATAHQMERYQLRQASGRVRALPPGLTLTQHNAADLPKKIVLILGESAARSHYGTYGYQYPTDPYLKSIATQHDRCVVVPKALSPASVTRESLIRVLSFASPIDDSAFMTQLNLIELAKKAQYSTYWISNQKKIGRHDTPVGIVASTAESSFFAKHDTSASYRGTMDIELLEQFDKSFKRDDSKQFIVVHLIGSHQAYTDRFDKEDANASSSSPKDVRDYDASVHHTDRVINAISSRLENLEPSVIVYAADHGEIVNVGHGRLEFILEQYEIPLIAFGDPRTTSSIRTSFEKFSNKEMGVFNTTNLIYVLAETMGYEVGEATSKRAIDEGQYFFNVDNHHYPISVLK